MSQGVVQAEARTGPVPGFLCLDCGQVFTDELWDVPSWRCYNCAVSLLRDQLQMHALGVEWE